MHGRIAMHVHVAEAHVFGQEQHNVRSLGHDAEILELTTGQPVADPVREQDNTSHLPVSPASRTWTPLLQGTSTGRPSKQERWHQGAPGPANGILYSPVAHVDGLGTGPPERSVSVWPR